VIQDLLDNQRILNTRDNLDLPCTLIEGRDINIKHSLESLRLSHFLMFVHRWLGILIVL
jgi:hypothetical protein